MNTLNEKLAKVLSISDEQECARSFEKFCIENFNSLPLPGENVLFDKAMWTASQFMPLSKADEAIVKRVATKLLSERSVDVAKTTVLALKDLIGNTKEQAIATWQEMLAAMSWQQMVPATAVRAVGGQLVNLGKIQKQIDSAIIQVNLGWVVDKDQLRVLVQTKDESGNPIPDVEMRITEVERGVVFTRKTNQDGSVVAPAVQVGPGEYQLQIVFMDKLVETPFFRV